MGKYKGLDDICDKIDNEINNDEILSMFNDNDLRIQKCENKINKIINYLKCFMDRNENLIKFDLNTPLIQCSDAKCKLIYPEQYFKSDINDTITKRCQFCRDKGKIKDGRKGRGKADKK